MRIVEKIDVSRVPMRQRAAVLARALKRRANEARLKTRINNILKPVNTPRSAEKTTKSHCEDRVCDDNDDNGLVEDESEASALQIVDKYHVRDQPRATKKPKLKPKPSAKREITDADRKIDDPVLYRDWSAIKDDERFPVAWGYTKVTTLPLVAMNCPPWSDSVEFQDADYTRPIAIQEYGGKMGWAHQVTGDMMMNDFLGQHMVITPGGCIAFSSDIFDWPALKQMTAYLKAGIRPPSKTYDWIVNGFKDHRLQRKIAPQLSKGVHDTITELLLELTDRQVNPREDGETQLARPHP